MVRNNIKEIGAELEGIEVELLAITKYDMCIHLYDNIMSMDEYILILKMMRNSLLAELDEINNQESN